MSPHLWIIGLVAVQRLAELAVARRNTARLLAQGGVEADAGHYGLIVALHAGWLAALAVAVPADAPIDLPLLALYAAVLALRVWTMASLGRYWTTRIITLAGAPLVKHGPYRFLRHPNYAVVAAEIALLPLVFGAWEIALVFSALNLVVLRRRIAAEDVALADRRRA